MMGEPKVWDGKVRWQYALLAGVTAAAAMVLVVLGLASIVESFHVSGMA